MSRPLAIAATAGLGLALLGLGGAALWLGFGAGSPAAGPGRGGSAPVNGAGSDSLQTAAGGSASAVEPVLRAADQAIAEERYASAIALLGSALAKAPENQDLRLKLAQAYIHDKRPELAVPQFQAALRIGPALAPIHFDLGTVASTAGQTQLALEQFQLAQSKDPNQARYPLYLGMVQVKLGQDDKAKANFVRAVVLDDALAEAWGTLADIELRQSSLDLAEQHIAKARELQPEFAQWKLVQARIWKRLGKTLQAAELLTALPDEERLTAPVLQTMAECFGLLNRPQLAAAQYIRAAAVHSGDGKLAFLAAQWAQRAGDHVSARNWATAAKNLGVDGAADLLARLDAEPTPASAAEVQK